ncbi:MULTISPECIES: CdaR family protein [Pontibacillus]|uniref:CdaR family protein n=1 Tax=Pontibacillus chungwhensis TaxID=265426 RepID=A0ABY8UYF6_9BACI|nr:MULTISPECIES: CdaR family protein [Pontibacillus]MCD5325770.1 YbbR-like domain-containing protein [Pontibacillus sp. HN14]WIF98303.1 CdaR family protein [Pontibacillus chungwhensis]
MDKWLRSPWFIRAISLILALLLYASINLDDGQSSSDSIFLEGNDKIAAMNNIPLQVKMNEEKYVVKEVPSSVTVTVEGPNSVVTRTVMQKTFEAYIDLEGLELGPQTVPIQTQGISNQLSVSIDPQEVNVVLEKRSSKEFQVGVDYIHRDTIKEGYQLGTPEVSPAQVDIIGSETEVSKVSLVKAIVDVQNAESDITKKESPVKVYDEQGNELNVVVEPSTVKVTVPLLPPSKEVPVTFEPKGELAKGYRLVGIEPVPEFIAVYGSQDALKGVSAFVDIEVDVSDLKEDTTLDVDLPLPDGIETMKPETVGAKVDVEQITEKTFNDVTINVNNLESSKNLTFITPEQQVIDLTLTGTKEELENITKEDFEVFIDVGQLVNGEANVPIEVNGPESIEWQTSNDEALIRIE